MASYAQIAAERVRVLDELDAVAFDNEKDEAALQRIIADAPWLIQPDWSVVTANQSLKTFRRLFQEYWKKTRGTDLTLAITYEKKRPDFILVASSSRLHLVEIKAAGHQFNDEDFVRLYNYVAAMEEFFKRNQQMRVEYGREWQIDLVTDDVELHNPINQRAFHEAVKGGQVFQMSWDDFRTRARQANEQFLEARDEAAKEAVRVMEGATERSDATQTCNAATDSSATGEKQDPSA